MEDQQTMPCPECKSEIHLDMSILMAGGKVTCENCQCSVSIPQDDEDKNRRALKSLSALQSLKQSFKDGA